MEFLYQGLKKNATVCFADSLNIDVIRAAHYLNKHKLAQPVLLGRAVQIREFASAHGLNTSGIKVRNPLHNARLYGLAKTIFEKNRPEISLFELQEKIKTPLWYGMVLLEQDKADILISGSPAKQQEVIRAMNFVLGKKDNAQGFSSFFLVYKDETERTMAFADCLFNARPSSRQLAETALNTARNFNKMTGQEAYVAMLSFSTAGSAEHEMAQKIGQAALLAKEMNPGLCLDGEIQFDAAFVPGVAAQKMPGSCLQGKANVFIFPSLNAADIALHLARDLAGYKTIGPFLQNTLKPVAFLPQTSGEQEIVRLVLAASKL